MITKPRMKQLKLYFLFFIILSLPDIVFAKSTADTISGNLTLKDCISYALKNQPVLRQSEIDREINERDIRIGLAGWLPQINSANSYDHYFKGTPVNGFVLPNGAAISDVSTVGVQASQVLYNNDVWLASKTANYSRLYYKQNETSSKINVVSDVSKAFFDVLLSQRQLDIIKEDIVRLQRSLKDAVSRYDAGVTDKIDSKQATIALNNEIATRKQTEESIKAKLAYLKQIMGLNAGKSVSLVYDSTKYEQEAVIDTNQQLNYQNRIEYQLLQTQKNLQNINVDYYRWGFLPSISAVGAYNMNYLSDRFSNLYSNNYPNLYAGVTLNIPIFTGTKRLQNVAKARLQVQRTDLDIENTQNTISTEYTQALASYKSNYITWRTLKDNVQLAGDVYKVVSLQYREGIKVYLDVIVAQSDLRTAELNYYNALFQLLSSKIDLEKALGNINVQ